MRHAIRPTRDYEISTRRNYIRAFVLVIFIPIVLVYSIFSGHSVVEGLVTQVKFLILSQFALGAFWFVSDLRRS